MTWVRWGRGAAARGRARALIALALVEVQVATACASRCEEGTCESPPIDGSTSTGSAEESTGDVRFDVASGIGGCGNGDSGRCNQVDLLFVIDNSFSMATEQENLARNFPRLVERLAALEDSEGNPVSPDVHVLVTTTDVGNPICLEEGPGDYLPAFGAPTTKGCNARLEDFVLEFPPKNETKACTNVCPSDVVAEDPYVAFSVAGDNVIDPPGRDIDGDGTPEPPAAEALACLGPQGIVGCGFESPLESMYLALAADAPWNVGPAKFLREDALLAIAILTDEVDCSLLDESIMENPDYYEEYMGQKGPSSAICWNAGVTCEGPDESGVYSDCHSRDDAGLQPLSRYVDLLVKEQRDEHGKEVVMLGIIGVPEVTEHDPDPPHGPIAGGEADLVYRDWRDGLVTEGGDILPEDADQGITAEQQQFSFGIGPACTGQQPDGTFTGQATPNTRVMEVCHALDRVDEDGGMEARCCIESVCSADFSPAIDCLMELIEAAIPPVG